MSWWDDDDDEMLDEENYAIRLWSRIWYDQALQAWVCNCRRFAEAGRCVHVKLYRPTAVVPVLERYL